MTTQPTTEAIWSHLSSDLRQFIRRRISDEHAADDLLQETFVRVHRNVGDLQEAGRLAAWVYQIARNVVRDHYRSAKNSAAMLGEAEVAANEPAGDSPSKPCGAAAWLTEMIRSLPDSYREAVQLAEIDGLSQREVADRLGISHSGAKSRIQRGRAMLRQMLERCCQLEFDGRGGFFGCLPRAHQKSCHDCD